MHSTKSMQLPHFGDSLQSSHYYSLPSTSAPQACSQPMTKQWLVIYSHGISSQYGTPPMVNFCSGHSINLADIFSEQYSKWSLFLLFPLSPSQCQTGIVIWNLSPFYSSLFFVGASPNKSQVFLSQSLYLHPRELRLTQEPFDSFTVVLIRDFRLKPGKGSFTDWETHEGSAGHRASITLLLPIIHAASEHVTRPPRGCFLFGKMRELN